MSEAEQFDGFIKRWFNLSPDLPLPGIVCPVRTQALLVWIFGGERLARDYLRHEYFAFARRFICDPTQVSAALDHYRP